MEQVIRFNPGMCLESFRCGRSYLELQITVIVTQKLEEVFGAGVLRNSFAGPDTCNHSGVIVLGRILVIILELERVFGVIPEQE